MYRGAAIRTKDPKGPATAEICKNVAGKSDRSPTTLTPAADDIDNRSAFHPAIIQ